MKIQLQHPFVNAFKAGYVNTNKEPRRVCLLVRHDNSKTSISYARYLMSCHLGRFLLPEEHIDHIDEDKMNDVIDNLQILSLAANNKKSKYKGVLLSFVCPVCNIEFKRPPNKVWNKENPTCSRKCGGKKSHHTVTGLSPVEPTMVLL